MNRHAEIEIDDNEGYGQKKRTFIWLPETQPFFPSLQKGKQINNNKKTILCILNKNNDRN